MQIDWWTLALQAVNALVLIWLLAHFLFRPVVDAIAARQKAAGQLLADAKADKGGGRERARQGGGGNRTPCRAPQRGVESGRSRGGDRKIGPSRDGSSRGRQASRLRQSRDRSRTPHRSGSPPKIGRDGLQSISRPSCSIDCRSEARVAAFIDGIATGLAKLPEGTRASLGADGASVRLTAARAVTPEEVEACRKALAGVLGHPVLLEVSVDPALIAGLELEAPHAIVRNSFRADLVRLKSELVHHDTDAA